MQHNNVISYTKDREGNLYEIIVWEEPSGKHPVKPYNPIEICKYGSSTPIWVGDSEKELPQWAIDGRTEEVALQVEAVKERVLAAAQFQHDFMEA